MMTDDLRSLAEYHAARANEYCRSANSTDQPQLKQRLQAKAAWHSQMSSKLSQFVEAFTVFIQTTGQ